MLFTKPSNKRTRRLGSVFSKHIPCISQVHLNVYTTAFVIRWTHAISFGSEPKSFTYMAFDGVRKQLYTLNIAHAYTSINECEFYSYRLCSMRSFHFGPSCRISECNLSYFLLTSLTPNRARDKCGVHLLLGKWSAHFMDINVMAVSITMATENSEENCFRLQTHP